MKQKVINYNQIGILANGPLAPLQNGNYYPAYPHIAENMTFKNGDMMPTVTPKGEIGSPSNIRRVFVTANTVFRVTYYNAGGSRVGFNSVGGTHVDKVIKELAGIHTYESSYTGKYNSSRDTAGYDGIAAVVHNIVNYEADYEWYKANRNRMNIVEPAKYSIEGSGMTLISYPYVMSNIEEVYFDWSLLVPRDNLYHLSGTDKVQVQNNMIYRYVFDIIRGCHGIKAPFTDDQLFDLFEFRNSGRYFDRRYPRLKVVAFVPNLSRVLFECSPSEGLERSDSRLSLKEVLQNSRTWITTDKVVQSIKNTGNAPVICNLQSEKRFITKPTTFVYDKCVLDRIFNAKDAEDMALSIRGCQGGCAMPTPNKPNGTDITDAGYIKKRLESAGIEHDLVRYLVTIAKKQQVDNGSVARKDRAN